MNVHHNLQLSLDHILALNNSCTRVRKSRNAESLSIIARIVRFVKDFFASGRKQNDIHEFNRYKSLIALEITTLQGLQNTPSDSLDFDQYYKKLKTLLHVKGKFEFTGWSKSLKKHEDYLQFIENLNDLSQHARIGVKAWIDSSKDGATPLERASLGRWIEATDEQIKFAGYSNEIAYRAEEIPLGAVILANPRAIMVKDRLDGKRFSFIKYLRLILGVIYKIFTGFPVIHAMASLGNGRFVHLSSSRQTKGAQIKGGSQPIAEDFSKGSPKYFFGYEVMIPNHQKIGKTLSFSQEQIEMGAVTEVLEKWSKTILSATEPEIGTLKPPKISTVKNILATIFNRSRPKNYDPTKEFKSHPDYGYSCSGFISASLAHHGIDIAKRANKKVHKIPPAGFIATELYDVAYSNDRQAAQAFRERINAK